MKEKHDIKMLDTNVTKIHAELQRLAANQGLLDLRELFPLPGWTTPAEFLFALGITNALLTHIKVINVLTETMIKGSRAVVNK